MVGIGGWLVPESGETLEASWFFVEITESSLPVVYHKGKDQTFRFIATLELLGTLLGMQAFVWGSNQKDLAAVANI
eukprot:6571296-Karenia_brevis.AAC.1